jgi:hypothetical protein
MKLTTLPSLVLRSNDLDLGHHIKTKLSLHSRTAGEEERRGSRGTTEIMVVREIGSRGMGSSVGDGKKGLPIFQPSHK